MEAWKEARIRVQVGEDKAWIEVVVMGMERRAWSRGKDQEEPSVGKDERGSDNGALTR